MVTMTWDDVTVLHQRGHEMSNHGCAFLDFDPYGGAVKLKVVR